jgi:signal peptidase I
MAHNNRKQDDGLGGSFVELIKTVLSAGLIAVLIHTFWFEPFYIPSGSMVPTLLVGDYLVVNKYTYGYSHFSFPFSPDFFSGRWPAGAPKRGDVAVFRPPGALDEDFIKRVIGLPGDTIQVTGGQLYINGNMVPRADQGTYSDDSDRFSEDAAYYNGPVLARDYLETLPNGKIHSILKRTDGPKTDGSFDQNNTPVYTVPAGDLFMMGDNRDNSEDSRFIDGPVGYVPVENIVGPARLIFFSIDMRHPFWEVWYWPFEIRWGRMFKSIS